MAPREGKSTTSDPVDVARRLYAVTSSGDLAQLDDILAPDVVDHGVDGVEELRGPAAVREALAAFRESFPDATLRVEDVFASADGEKVAVRWTVSATQRGAFQGIPASGRGVRMSGIDVLRVVDGRVAERWGSSDELGLLQQLVDRRTGDDRRAGQPIPPGLERRATGRRRSDVNRG
ncbi:MAG TPA: ester cyclase [Chloroflexota bacterium]|nr:ester cyclase [Chloroflexota bacterium]